MAQQNYDQIMQWLSAYEGGYVNHPKDPGGATMRGVTQRVYDAYRRNIGRPLRPVKQMTNPEHDAIYRQQYWNPVFGDRLPSGVDAAIFDFAVNSGTSRAVKYTQKIVGATADGVMGNMTLAAIKDYCEKKSAAELCGALCEARLAFMKRLSTWSTFGKGWQRRVMGDKMGVQHGDVGVIDRSIALTRGGGASIPLPKRQSEGKATGSPSALRTIIQIILSLFGGRSVAQGV